ncbi:hypothetical protein SAMD00019534_118900 [Acytostelium subglobosum LB1]|uniref:hypothetical protein n=1 Tax=Acytostelium subglobosum LB1 TaxID=1410327 RepID=UPI0006450C43|nr:hypothetical protein SAMD00019534_118900 [Acytostelium subglobosum LB1]GAM28714.1 hypothetical protein SAMD00019534_118900 [Acytostelium subglobosum LB1]|eukprot:XP_012748269.1 hypothetical protein SAMD00019534_118900 [Acytostelium subglobosum LB1]
MITSPIRYLGQTTPRFLLCRQHINVVSLHNNYNNKYNNKYSTTSLSRNVNDDPIFYHRDLHSNKDVFVIGTAHISKRSAEQVKQFIRDVKPDTVVLELCQSRFDKLKSEQNVRNIEPYQQSKPLTSIFAEIMAGLRSGQLNAGNILNILIKNYYNTFRVMGIVPGLEFKFAINEADALKANIVLGDLPVNETMSNLAQSLKTELLPMVGGSMMGGLGALNMANIMNMASNMKMDQSKMADWSRVNDILAPLVEELSKPAVTEEELESAFKKVLTNANLQEIRSTFQRSLPMTYDAFLLDRERSITKSILSSKGNRVLAVVGAMHVDGIKGMLEEKNR